ncbi:MAG: hypothetical protein U0229_00875 [Anaeromyxobacter sp.]
MLELALALLLSAEEPKAPEAPAPRAPEASAPREPAAPPAAEPPKAAAEPAKGAAQEPPKAEAQKAEPPKTEPARAAHRAAAPKGKEKDAKEPEAKDRAEETGAAAAERAAGALVRAQAASETSTPPSLTGRALVEELRRNSVQRAADRSAVQADRMRLETLAKEIAEARAALKEETQKLEALLAATAAKNVAGRDAAGQSALDALSKTVKGMKPAEAAAVLSRVDRPLAATLLERMRPADAAQVVGKMEPSVAADLFKLLARASGRKP